MKINYFSETSIEALQQQLLLFEQDSEIKGIILLACDENNYIPKKLNPVLTSLRKPIFGGVFPGVIIKDKKHETGFIIAGFNSTPEVNIIENISSTSTILDDEVLKLAENYMESKTLFVFIDGFAERISAFIESIFTIFGLEFNYIGGGAGSLSLKQKPCIFTNKGIKQDCALIAGIDLDSGIGVKHGWKSISGPYKVTSAEKTVIKELDFKPAFEVYKQAVEKHSGAVFKDDNFFDIAKAYPFGINKVDAEKVVRDPLFLGENNSLICVGEVETGSFVDILTGDKNSLIQAAGQAVKVALENKQNPVENFIFFVDCISRVLFLEDDFEKELDVVVKPNIEIPVFGVLSIGEIANNGQDYLEFYNKTSVIGCF